MVDISSRLEYIKTYIDEQKFFVMNRAKQYGKTTTLNLLTEKLKDEYAVFLLSFEGMGSKAFEDEDSFGRMFCGILYDAIAFGEVDGISEAARKQLAYVSSYTDENLMDMRRLANIIYMICRESQKPIVLIIDEMDRASGFQVFWDFMGMIRNMYLHRVRRPSLHSVLLAGVYDNKSYMNTEQNQQMGGPWNIAEMFRMDMSFSAQEIAGMLSSYEEDHRTGMDIEKTANWIYEYTSGYPYLVSCICKIMDELLCSETDREWNEFKLERAIQILLKDAPPLFSDINRKITEYPELRSMLYSMLMRGTTYPHNRYCLEMNIGSVTGFLKDESEVAVVSNRIFEMWMYNLFIMDDILENRIYQRAIRNRERYIKDGTLDMDLVLQKFGEYFQNIYTDADLEFKENEGRRLFMQFLKPIINGQGNFYVNAENRNRSRTDVIVEFQGHVYEIVMKIWHGEEFYRRETALAGYMDTYGKEKGYLLSFCVVKTKPDRYRVVNMGNRTLVEAVV